MRNCQAKIEIVKSALASWTGWISKRRRSRLTSGLNRLFTLFPTGISLPTHARSRNGKIAMMFALRQPLPLSHAVRIVTTAHSSWTNRLLASCRLGRVLTTSTATKRWTPPWADSVPSSPIGKAPGRRKSRRTKWTTEMDQVLFARRREGKTALQISSELGLCSESAIRDRYRTLRRHEGRKTSIRRWSESEDIHLINRRQEGATHAQIAKHLGRTRIAVTNRARLIAQRPGSLITIGQRTNTSKRAWTADERDLLLRMRADGSSWTEIAGKLGRTPIACNHQGSRFRVYLPSSRRWSADEDALLARLRLVDRLSMREISPHFPRRSLVALSIRALKIRRESVSPGPESHDPAAPPGRDSV